MYSSAPVAAAEEEVNKARRELDKARDELDNFKEYQKIPVYFGGTASEYFLYLTQQVKERADELKERADELKERAGELIQLSNLIAKKGESSWTPTIQTDMDVDFPTEHSIHGEHLFYIEVGF